jgi:hypothetical protein
MNTDRFVISLTEKDRSYQGLYYKMTAVCEVVGDRYRCYVEEYQYSHKTNEWYYYVKSGPRTDEFLLREVLVTQKDITLQDVRQPYVHATHEQIVNRALEENHMK